MHISRFATITWNASSWDLETTNKCIFIQTFSEIQNSSLNALDKIINPDALVC